MDRPKDGDNPRNVELNTLDLWIQIHDLKAGFMSEKIIKQVGNYIGTFIESCPSNFVGVWREFMRVRVRIDLSKPLKRRIKLIKSGDDWYWISFKYENIPTFCFICGILGHSEKFCSQLFVTPEQEIIKPYGAWMRAPFRRQVKQIGAQWLRNGVDDLGPNSKFENPINQGREDYLNQDPKSMPQSQGPVIRRDNFGDQSIQNAKMGGTQGGNPHTVVSTIIKATNNENDGTIIESKKRRVLDGLDLTDNMGLNTEISMESTEETHMILEHESPRNVEVPKNVTGASIQGGARLAL